MKEKIAVVIKKPGKTAEVKNLSPNSPLLARVRNAVPGEKVEDDIPGISGVYGYSQLTAFGNTRPNIFYPDAKLFGFYQGDTVYGTVLYAAEPERDGELKSLSDDQIKRVTDYVNQNAVKNPEEDTFHQITRFKHYKSARSGCVTESMMSDIKNMQNNVGAKTTKKLLHSISLFSHKGKPTSISSSDGDEIKFYVNKRLTKAKPKPIFNDDSIRLLVGKGRILFTSDAIPKKATTENPVKEFIESKLVESTVINVNQDFVEWKKTRSKTYRSHEKTAPAHSKKGDCK